MLDWEIVYISFGGRVLFRELLVLSSFWVAIAIIVGAKSKPILAENQKQNEHANACNLPLLANTVTKDACKPTACAAAIARVKCAKKREKTAQNDWLKLVEKAFFKQFGMQSKNQSSNLQSLIALDLLIKKVSAVRKKISAADIPAITQFVAALRQVRIKSVKPTGQDYYTELEALEIKVGEAAFSKVQVDTAQIAVAQYLSRLVKLQSSVSSFMADERAGGGLIKLLKAADIGEAKTSYVVAKLKTQAATNAKGNACKICNPQKPSAGSGTKRITIVKARYGDLRKGGKRICGAKKKIDALCNLVAVEQKLCYETPGKDHSLKVCLSDDKVNNVTTKTVYKRPPKGSEPIRSFVMNHKTMCGFNPAPASNNRRGTVVYKCGNGKKQNSWKKYRDGETVFIDCR